MRRASYTLPITSSSTIAESYRVPAGPGPRGTCVASGWGTNIDPIRRRDYGNHRVDRARPYRGRDRQGAHAGPGPGRHHCDDSDRNRRRISRRISRQSHYGQRAERILAVEHHPGDRRFDDSLVDLPHDESPTREPDELVELIVRKFIPDDARDLRAALQRPPRVPPIVCDGFISGCCGWSR